MIPFVLTLPLLLTSLASPGPSDAADLAKAFKGRDQDKIAAALSGLEELGARGVDGLLAGTRHDETWVRVSAWRALGELKGEGAAAIGPLCQHIAKLRRIEGHDVVAVQEMLPLFMMSGMSEVMACGKPFPEPKGETKEDAYRAELNIERLVSLSALKKLTEPDPAAVLPHLAQAEVALGQDYSDVHTGFAVGTLFNKAKRLVVLEAGLMHENPRVQVACLLASCGIEEEIGTLPQLAEKLVSAPDPGVRGPAWAALITLAPESDAVREGAAAALADESAYVRVHVARALALRGGRGELALPVLLACMTDESPSVRSAAIQTFESDLMAGLMAIGKKKPPPSKDFQPKAAVSPLTKALADRDLGVKSRAARALGDFGAEAKSALPALKKLVKGGNKDVRAAVELAIAKIEDAG